MKKMLLALGALLASVAFVPAAHAEDCDPDDGAAEFARCLAENKLRKLGKAMTPPNPMSRRAAASEMCDPDDDDFKACMRALRMQQRAGQGLPPGARRPAAARPAPGAPTADAPAGTPSVAEARPDAGEGAVCTKYMSSLGRQVAVPCQ